MTETNEMRIRKGLSEVEKSIEVYSKNLEGLMDVTSFIEDHMALSYKKLYGKDCCEFLNDLGIKTEVEDYASYEEYKAEFRDKIHDSAFSLHMSLSHKVYLESELPKAIKKDARKTEKARIKEEEKKREREMLLNKAGYTTCTAIEEFLESWKESFLEYVSKNKEFENMSEADLLKIADAEVDGKRVDLIYRVYKKAGKIVDAGFMRVGANGSLNGYIKGEIKTVNVETIFAGGYNIQRLHYRVLVH